MLLLLLLLMLRLREEVSWEEPPVSSVPTTPHAILGLVSRMLFAFPFCFIST